MFTVTEVQMITDGILFFAVVVLSFAFVIYPRPGRPMFRLDKIEYHDGATLYYPMKRVSFGRWKVLEVEPGVRGYREQEEAQKALEDYLYEELDLEMSETTTVKEYG